jgi:hypothetical protein
MPINLPGKASLVVNCYLRKCCASLSPTIPGPTYCSLASHLSRPQTVATPGKDVQSFCYRRCSPATRLSRAARVFAFSMDPERDAPLSPEYHVANVPAKVQCSPRGIGNLARYSCASLGTDGCLIHLYKGRHLLRRVALLWLHHKSSESHTASIVHELLAIHLVRSDLLLNYFIHHVQTLGKDVDRHHYVHMLNSFLPFWL